MAATLPTNVIYDLFLFATPQQRETIQSFNDVVVVEDTPGTFSFVSDTGLLSLKSTGGISSLVIGDSGFSIPADFGYQIEILLPTGNLPADFSSLGTDRVFIGVENDQPSGDLLAGFLISEAGIAIADSPTSVNTVLPGSDTLVAQFRQSSGEPLILRAAFREDASFAPTQHILSIAIGQQTKQIFIFEQGSLPFPATTEQRLKIEVLAPALSTREVLLGLMGLSTTINTYASTVQPNPGPDQVVELGDVTRLDGTTSLAEEQIVVSGLDLRSAALEPEFDEITGVAIPRTGDTAAGSGFTDTFTITAPTTAAKAIPNTNEGDFIVINGVSHIIDTIAGLVITVTEPKIALGLTGATWQIFSRTIVETPRTELIGVVVGDTLRIETTDNANIYVVSQVLSLSVPFRLELTTPLVVATSDMQFAIGPSLRPPTTLQWTVIEVPTDSALVDPTDFHRDGAILRFVPDVTGSYRLELTVDSPVGDFVPSFIDIVVEVLDQRLSPGENPDASFLRSTISDFYTLPPDLEPLETMWSGAMQVTADELISLYQRDYGKSLNDIQRTFQRKFQKIETTVSLTEPQTSSTLPAPTAAKASGIAGTTVVGNIFEDLTATFLTDGINVGDILSFSGSVFAILEILSETRVRIVDENFVEGQTSILWDILPALWVFGTENLIELKITAGDTVRFVLVGPTGDVFRVEEEILLTVDRRAFLDPNIPQLTLALADRGIAFSELQELTVEGLRRHNIFPLDLLVTRIPFLQEIVPTAPDLYQHNLNFLVEAEQIRIIEDFDGFKLFTLQRTSGTAGVTLADNILEDTSATFITSGVKKGDTLHLGVTEFKISEVISETQIRVADPLVVGQTALTWRISHIAPDRLWAEFLFLDNSPTIQANFGHLVDLTKTEADDVNFDYLAAVRGLFNSFFSGPTIDSIRVGLELLNGLPVSEEDGEIIEITNPINSRIGRIRVRDARNPAIVRIYFYPQDLGLADTTDPITGETRPLQLGDTVAQFQSLSKGVTVDDYIDTPKWWTPFANQGLFNELEKYATFQATISDKIFDINNVSFVLQFLNNIKPTYTKVAFIISASLFADDIEVLDAKSKTITKNMVSGVFVPPCTFDDAIDGAGSIIKRLDFDTNYPVSVSPHLELSEVSKFQNLDGSALPVLARLSDLRDPAHAVVKSSSTRFGTGSVQPDGKTFISAPGSFTGTDSGKDIVINSLPRIISSVLSDTTIEVAPNIFAFTGVIWTIIESTGTIFFPPGGNGELSDLSATFINGSGVPLVDEGDFLEILHPDINSGEPLLVHIVKADSSTKLLFTNQSALFDKGSAIFTPGTHTNATWTVFRGLRYMPKPAINDVDLGDNETLNESLVPPARVDSFRVTVDTVPTLTPSGIQSATPLLSDGLKSTVDSGTSISSGTSLITIFSNLTLVANSVPLPIDGSTPTPLGLPPIARIILFDRVTSAPDGFRRDGSRDHFDVYTTTDPAHVVWVLHESFNQPGDAQVMRFNNRTEIILSKPMAGGVVGVKLHFPSGFAAPNFATMSIVEMEMHLSEEFEHLKKNHHLDLADDSRPEDAMFARRNLADGDSMSGTGDVAGDSVTFTDTSFGGVAYCFHDLGKSITIDGETRRIVQVLPSGSDMDTIVVDSALSGAPKVGVAWDITASGADIDDGDIR